jgi:hypothetical protein
MHSNFNLIDRSLEPRLPRPVTVPVQYRIIAVAQSVDNSSDGSVTLSLVDPHILLLV